MLICRTPLVTSNFYLPHGESELGMVGTPDVLRVAHDQVPIYADPQNLRRIRDKGGQDLRLLKGKTVKTQNRISISHAARVSGAF